MYRDYECIIVMSTGDFYRMKNVLIQKKSIMLKVFALLLRRGVFYEYTVDNYCRDVQQECR